MKIRILILLFFTSCVSSSQEKSDFFTNCECSKIELQSGIEITDNLGRFSIKFPSKHWKPTTLTESGNGIVGALIDGESFKSFGVTELTKADNWMGKKEMQVDIESEYNVIASGSTKINGIESSWNLVNFNNEIIPSLTLYITIEHPTENLFYTLNLSVSKDKYGIEELCELESLIRTFQIK